MILRQWQFKQIADYGSNNYLDNFPRVLREGVIEAYSKFSIE